MCHIGVSLCGFVNYGFETGGRPMTIKVVDIIVERKGMILFTKRGDYWILPGGEIEPGEDELQCLDEVVSKEMKDQVSSIFKKLEKTIKGPSPVRGSDVEVSVYVGDIGSKKMSDVKDCNAHWFSRESLRAIRLSNITKAVLEYYYSEGRESEKSLEDEDVKKLRIIIFEDDSALASLLKHVLMQKGHDVLVFPDPTACPVYTVHETVCQRKTPCADVIISDHMMPNMSGIDFFKLQRKRGCKALDANKALITGAAISDYMKHAVDELGCHFIKKPFKVAKIVEWVGECAERVRLAEVS
jgi:CheY-like chemotaxis protein